LAKMSINYYLLIYKNVGLIVSGDLKTGDKGVISVQQTIV